MYIYSDIQGDLGGNVNILGCNNIGHCERKNVHMHTCILLYMYTRV